VVAADSFLIEQADNQDIPGRITELTGITNKDLRLSAITAQSVCQRILLELTSDSELIGSVIHYAKFEKQFLEDLMSQWAGLDCLPKPIVCTHQIAKRLYPDLPSKGIRALHGHFGGSVMNFKRAACHAEATHLIWSKMVAELACLGVLDFVQLLEWLESSPSRSVHTTAIQRHHVDAALRLALPDHPGVYRMLNSRGEVLYVGKATSLKARVNSYFRGQTKKDLKTREMLLQTWNIEVTECSTALDAAIFESDEIKRLEPPYNISLKKGRRQLLFYSKTFDSFHTDRDSVHSLGPFVGHRVFEPLYLLCQGAGLNQFDGRIFLNMVSPEDIASGYEVFCRRFRLDRSRPLTVRQLLALGAKIARGQKLLVNLSAQREIEPLTESILDEQVEAVSIADSELDPEEEPTPEDFADAIEKLLRHAAIAYSRAKALLMLSDSRIAYSEKSQKYILDVSGGEIGQSVCALSESGYDALPERRDTPWSLEKYDRLRVLLSELIRMKNKGKRLYTTPDLWLFLR
jgi:DNA polymerase-3 subunit epsilon